MERHILCKRVYIVRQLIVTVLNLIDIFFIRLQEDNHYTARQLIITCVWKDIFFTGVKKANT